MCVRWNGKERGGVGAAKKNFHSLFLNNSRLRAAVLISRWLSVLIGVDVELRILDRLHLVVVSSDWRIS